MQLKYKILALTMAPLVIAILLITGLTTWQSTSLARHSIEAFERHMLESRQNELMNLTNLALSAIDEIYRNAGPEDEEAKRSVRDILSSLDYGPDGYFFVYDYDGVNVVHPRQNFRLGENWLRLQDPNGNFVIANLIERAREGGGLHQYLWEKPSAGADAEKLSFAVGLDKWEWMLGTGVYLDDVYAQTAVANAELERTISATFLSVGMIAVPAVLLVFGTGMAINLHERRLADTKLKDLAQRVIDTQEEERARIAKELHDGISQILIGARYAIDLARRKADQGAPGAGEAIRRGGDALNGAIQEIRRLSHELRPSALDDLGLSAAVEALIDSFSERTGVDVHFETVSFKNLIQPDVRTALYRIAQEALTNIERHANATHVDVAFTTRKGRVQMKISDNGKGFPAHARERAARSTGLGLRNMQERVAHFGGTFLIQSSAEGTTLLADFPRSVFLPPEEAGMVA